MISWLQDDTELAAFMTDNDGHWFAFGETEKLPVRPQKTDLPAIIIGTMTRQPKWAMNASQDEVWQLLIEAMEDERDLASIELLTALICTALASGDADQCFGVRDTTGLYMSDVAGTRFVRAYEDQQNQLNPLYWKSDITFNMTFRRVPTASPII